MKTCDCCLEPIRVMAFQGTGVCSENCRKAMDEYDEAMARGQVL